MRPIPASDMAEMMWALKLTVLRLHIREQHSRVKVERQRGFEKTRWLLDAKTERLAVE